MVLERTAPGGQARSSMRIENYLGFPTGITGSELADRAVLQADKFGARVSIPAPVINLTFDKAYSVLGLEGGETVVAKCLLIASGAEYRRLGVDGCDQFEGCGVYYAATPNEAQMCRASADQAHRDPARTRGQGLGVSACAPHARRHQPDQGLPLCDELRSSPPEYLDVVRADMRASL